MYDLTSLSNQIQNGQQFILAKDDAGYQGYASYEINYKKIGVTKIYKIYVLPSAQGKGVGKKLINCMAAIARQNNNQTLALNVYRKNPAIEFYEKIGFKKIREVDIDAGNGFMFDDFEMEMSL
jgi:ribosomal protein S18 acetylase RimI-like enzyme